MKNDRIDIVSSDRMPSAGVKKSQEPLRRCEMAKTNLVRFKDYGCGIREATKRIKWIVPVDAPSKPEELPFVDRDENGRIVWWSVTLAKTDHWSVHRMLGRAYAFELFDLLNNPAAESNEHILGCIAEAMLSAVRRSGDWREAAMVEGFFGVVGEYISTGRVNR